MEHPVDPEAMDAHCLHHSVSTILVRVTFIWVESDRLCLLMRHYLAHRPIFGKATVTFLHFLDDSELLALINSTVLILGCRIFRQVFQLHVLEDYTIEAD